MSVLDVAVVGDREMDIRSGFVLPAEERWFKVPLGETVVPDSTSAPS